MLFYFTLIFIILFYDVAHGVSKIWKTWQSYGM